MRVLGLLSLGLLLASAAPLAAQGAASTRDGVYSEAQAQRGRTLYDRVCVDCHELDDFRGRTFLGEWVGGTLYDLYDYMVQSMPEDAPGSRSAGEYAAALAFILRTSGFPAGQGELSPDAARLKAIRFEAPAQAGGGPRR